MPRPSPLAHPVLFGEAGRIVMGQGTGIMIRGTEQVSALDAKRLGYEGVDSADSRQSVDGYARILRIMLLARKSSLYSSAPHDVRGILLDSYC